MKANGRFHEMTGGVIIGPTGREVARVAVDDLTTAEAARVARTIVAALEVEFADILPPGGGSKLRA